MKSHLSEEKSARLGDLRSEGRTLNPGTLEKRRTIEGKKERTPKQLCSLITKPERRKSRVKGEGDDLRENCGREICEALDWFSEKRRRSLVTNLRFFLQSSSVHLYQPKKRREPFLGEPKKVRFGKEAARFFASWLSCWFSEMIGRERKDAGDNEHAEDERETHLLWRRWRNNVRDDVRENSSSLLLQILSITAGDCSSSLIPGSRTPLRMKNWREPW